MSRSRNIPGQARQPGQAVRKPPVERCIYCGRAAGEVDELFPAEVGPICAKCIYRIAQQIKADHKQNQLDKQSSR